MFCGKCGQKNLSTDSFCISCGRPLNISSETHSVQLIPEQQTTVALVSEVPIVPSELKPIEINQSSVAEPQNKELTDIGGWLLLFFLRLCFIGPAMDLIQLQKSSSPVMAIFFFSYTALRVYVAVSIYKRWPSAIRNVRIYFIVAISLGLLFFALACLVIVLDLDSQGLAGDLFRTSIEMLIADLIWILYFHKSKRVKLTLGRNLFERKEPK